MFIGGLSLCCCRKKPGIIHMQIILWPEGERCKIIDGMAYMQAASSPVHKEVLNGINVQFYILPKIPICMI